MSVTQLLTEAKQLVESGWTQYAFARDEKGFEVWVENNKACSYCLDGALLKITILRKSNLYGDVYHVINKIIGEKGYFTGLVNFNDTEGRTKEEIIEVLDKAIAVSKGM